jgi:cytochrome c553
MRMRHKQMADIRAGRRDNPRMYPFATEHVLSTREIADVAAYLSRLEIPSTNGKGPGADLATGERLYARDCAGCHGKSGEGSARQFYPMVAGQHYLYLLRQGREIRDGQRRNANPKMAKVVKPYSDAELQAVSDYMSRLVHARGAPSGSKGRKSWAAAPSYRREAARRGSTRSKERCA